MLSGIILIFCFMIIKQIPSLGAWYFLHSGCSVQKLLSEKHCGITLNCYPVPQKIIMFTLSNKRYMIPWIPKSFKCCCPWLFKNGNLNIHSISLSCWILRNFRKSKLKKDLKHITHSTFLCRLLVDEGIIPLLLRHLVWNGETTDCIAEVAWVLTYLAAGWVVYLTLWPLGALDEILK